MTKDELIRATKGYYNCVPLTDDEYKYELCFASKRDKKYKIAYWKDGYFDYYETFDTLEEALEFKIGDKTVGEIIESWESVPTLCLDANPIFHYKENK